MCFKCTADDAKAEYPTHDGLVMTRVEWTGHDTKTGQPVLLWEGNAGDLPSQVQFPGVRFVPTQAWCPNCLQLYRIGRPHPVECQPEDEAPKIQVVK